MNNADAKIKDWDKHLTAERRAAVNAYNAHMGALAAQYREEVLLPLCRKLQVTYVSGMGEYFFHHLKTDTYISCEEDVQRFYFIYTEDGVAPPYNFDALIPTFKVLDQELIYDSRVGHIINDITEADLQ